MIADDFGPSVAAGQGAAAFGWVAVFLVTAALAASIWMGYLGSTRVQYFPKSYLEDVWVVGKPFAGQSGPIIVDAMEEDWYSRYWRAADEPSLYLASQNPNSPQARSVRFTWLRSFHSPMIVRIDTLADGQLRIDSNPRRRKL